MRTLLTFITLIITSGASLSAQSIDKQLLANKYWVENIEQSTNSYYTFNSQNTYTKNNNVPYSINAFHLKMDKKGTFYDWGTCKLTTPPKEDRGEWSIQGEVLSIKTSLCEQKFKIVSINENELKLKTLQ